MPFGVETGGDQRRHVLGDDPSPTTGPLGGGAKSNNTYVSLKLPNHLFGKKRELQCSTVYIWRGYFYGGEPHNNSDSLQVASHLVMYKILTTRKKKTHLTSVLVLVPQLRGTDDACDLRWRTLANETANNRTSYTTRFFTANEKRQNFEIQVLQGNTATSLRCGG